jgi:uncharacterized membrane protein YhaH (DUF805 family)
MTDFLKEQALLTTAFGAAVFVVTLVACATVVRKAGWSRWWALILLVPFVNVVMLCVFAFSKWPLRSDLEAATYVIDQQVEAQTPQPGDRFRWGP